jgi:hypothetical protein
MPDATRDRVPPSSAKPESQSTRTNSPVMYGVATESYRYGRVDSDMRYASHQSEKPVHGTKTFPIKIPRQIAAPFWLAADRFMHGPTKPVTQPAGTLPRTGYR